MSDVSSSDDFILQRLLFNCVCVHLLGFKNNPSATYRPSWLEAVGNWIYPPAESVDAVAFPHGMMPIANAAHAHPDPAKFIMCVLLLLVVPRFASPTMPVASQVV